jgi:hypothetical protein
VAVSGEESNREEDIEKLINKLAPEMARNLSKTGSLHIAPRALGLLRTKLNAQQVVALYVYIRDKSGRLEEEWRDEFIEAFPGLEGSLPAVEVPAGSWTIGRPERKP